jgi:hypothetical protein
VTTKIWWSLNEQYVYVRTPKRILKKFPYTLGGRGCADEAVEAARNYIQRKKEKCK